MVNADPLYNLDKSRDTERSRPCKKGRELWCVYSIVGARVGLLHKNKEIE